MRRLFILLLLVVGLQVRGQVVDKNFTGVHQTWWDEDTKQIKKTTTHYKKGLKHGSEEQFYQKGKLRQRTHYVKGEVHGTFESWYTNGVPKEKGEYVQGKKEGTWQTWGGNGKPIKKEEYHNGQLQAPGEEELVAQQDSVTGPEPVIRRNEIGANIAPLAVALLGGYTTFPEYTLTYRRASQNKAFRIGGLFKIFTGFENYYPYAPAPYSFIGLQDTTITTYEHVFTSNSYGGFIGMERRMQSDKMQLFYGMDAVFYAQLEKGHVVERAQELDSLGHIIDITETELAEDGRRGSTENYHVGIRPFFGLLFHVGNRVAISGSIGASIYYDFGQALYFDENSMVQKDSFTGNSLETNGLLQELSVYYKF